MKTLVNLILLLITITGYGQTPVSTLTKETKSRIDSAFAPYDNPNSPGYAIGIVKGTKVLYTRGYGSANLDYEIPITMIMGKLFFTVFTCSC